MPGPADDELAILRLAARLAQAADDRDEAAYRACLADSVSSGHADAGGASSPAGQYAREAIARASRADWTHHKLMNGVVQIDRDGRGGTATIDVVIDLRRTDPDGASRRVTLGGRYDLGLVKLAGAWRIERRVLHRRYVEEL